MCWNSIDLYICCSYNLIKCKLNLMKTASKKGILPVPVLLKLGNLIDKAFFKRNFKFLAPFYGWDSTASRLEPFRGGSLLFTSKFPWYMIECQYFLHISFKKQTSVNVLVESVPQPTTLVEKQMSCFPELLFQKQGRNKLWPLPPPLKKKITW